MDAAKASVKKVLGKSGHHDTTIHEKVAPAVQHETIAQKQHEHVTPAIDREIHQDHYHTSEQPVHHAETLPEQHHHREIPIEHKKYEHDDAEGIKRKLETERAGYKDRVERVEGEKTKSTEPTVAGEHVHHHVYENIQPVVQKQTVEPHVVHTTVPIHETHHNTAQHHSASALPAVSMDEFKKSGGALQGRDERRDFFPGEPKSFGNHHTGGGDAVVMDGHGANASGYTSQLDPKYNDSRDPTVHTGSHATHDDSSSRLRGTDGIPTTGSHATHSTPDTNTSTYNTTASSNAGAPSKPSFFDKINPKKDADGDGKPGFMK